jgi:hypothetical protein
MAGALAGCTPGKHPFLMIQICLGDADNLAAFTREMQAIAKNENMKFIDGSDETTADLAVIDAKGGAHDPNGPVIHMAVERGDSMGMSAGNLGLPGYQVALGFSEGSNPNEARMFVKRVVGRLAERWRVETVPPGRGAQPMENCNTSLKGLPSP